MKLKAVMDQDGEIRITEQSNNIRTFYVGCPSRSVWVSVPIVSKSIWIMGINTHHEHIYDMLVGIGVQPVDCHTELPLTDEQTRIILGYLSL